jgi:hypothetical protein
MNELMRDKLANFESQAARYSEIFRYDKDRHKTTA